MNNCVASHAITSSIATKENLKGIKKSSNTSAVGKKAVGACHKYMAAVR